MQHIKHRHSQMDDDHKLCIGTTLEKQQIPLHHAENLTTLQGDQKALIMTKPRQ